MTVQSKISRDSFDTNSAVGNLQLFVRKLQLATRISTLIYYTMMVAHK